MQIVVGTKIFSSIGVSLCRFRFVELTSPAGMAADLTEQDDTHAGDKGCKYFDTSSVKSFISGWSASRRTPIAVALLMLSKGTKVAFKSGTRAARILLFDASSRICCVR